MNDWQLSGSGDISKMRSNGTVAEFNYPCSTNYECSYYFSTLPPGYYKAEVWGAQGGGGSIYDTFRECAAMGGYSVGVFYLKSPTKVFVFIGGKGEDGKPHLGRGCRGGFNGGGSTSADDDNYHIAGGGGGSSDIRIENTKIETNSDSRIIVAGGSGGYSYGPAYYNSDSHGWGGGEIAGPTTDFYGRNFGQSATSSSGYQKLNGQHGAYSSGGAASGGGGGGYFGGYAPLSYTGRYNLGYPSGGGGSGYIGGVIDYQDIKKQTLAGNESFSRLDGSYGIGNPGNGAARITILGYSLTLNTKLQKNFIPGSTISLDFNLSSMGNDEEAKIFRSINDTADTLIKTHPDDGNVFNFLDSFDLPFISGKYNIKYTVQSKSNTNTTTTIEILVTKTPQLQILNNPKPKYTKEESISLEIELSDDTYADLHVNDSPCFNQQFRIICNNILNRTKIEFNIPKAYEVGSTHNFTIGAFDEFGLQSSAYSFTYTIVSNRSPDTKLSNNISYILDSRSPIEVKGFVRDYEIPSNVCLMTSLDKTSLNKHDCIDIKDTDWNPFKLTVSVDRLSSGIHSLSIYSIDDRQGESNTIVHQFAFSKKFILVQQNTCEYNSPLPRLYTNSLLYIAIFL